MDEFQTVIAEPEELTEATEIEEIDSDDTDESLAIKIVQFLRLLWSRRKMVGSIVLVGMVISTAYALLLKNIYTSRTTLMPPGNTSSYSTMLGFLANPEGGIASQALGLNSPGDLNVSILQSENVQDGLISRFGLMEYFRAKLLDDARRSLKNESTIDSDVKSGVITISVVDKSPVMAANLANGYVTELNRVLTEQSTSSARRERIFLEERLKGVKKDLDDSSRALSQFATKSKTLAFDDQAKSMVDQGAKLQGDLIESRSEVAALRQTYSTDNPRLKAAQARLNELQRQINALGGFTGEKHASTTMYPTAAELPTLGLTYSDLQRNVKLDEALWETLTRQYESAKVDEAKEIPVVRVLDVGKVPEKKSAPTRRFILMGGILLSFILACVVVVAREQWNGLEEESELKKLLLDITGYVTRIVRKMKKTKEEVIVVE